MPTGVDASRRYFSRDTTCGLLTQGRPPKFCVTSARTVCRIFELLAAEGSRHLVGGRERLLVPLGFADLIRSEKNFPRPFPSLSRHGRVVGGIALPNLSFAADTVGPHRCRAKAVDASREARQKASHVLLLLDAVSGPDISEEPLFPFRCPLIAPGSA